MEENKIYCSHCGALIEDDDYEEVGGEIVCTDCYEHHTTTCERCGSVIWTDDSYGDEYTTLCSNCYHNHYTRCSCCDALLHEDDAYHLDGYDYSRLSQAVSMGRDNEKGDLSGLSLSSGLYLRTPCSYQQRLLR